MKTSGGKDRLLHSDLQRNRWPSPGRPRRVVQARKERPARQEQFKIIAAERKHGSHGAARLRIERELKQSI